MIFIPFPIQKQAQGRSKTPSLIKSPKHDRKTFVQKAHDIRFPKVSLEGELYKTHVTEPSPILSPSQSPSPCRQRHLTKAVKIAKALPTVDIVESFDYGEKSAHTHATGFKQSASSPKRNLSLDSSKYSQYPKFKTNIKDTPCNQQLFKVFALTPKKIIAHLQSSQYVRKNSSSREKVTLLSVNYGSTRRPSFINYYY